MAEEQKERDLSLSELLQVALTELLKDKIEEDDVVVLLLHTKTRWSAWIYPVKADFNIAEKLATTGLIHIKQLNIRHQARMEEEKADKSRSVYTC